jgi:hypothetical protein
MNAYLDERMNAKDKRDFEGLLSDCSETREIFKKKKAHLDFILDLIPNESLSSKGQSKLEREFSDVNESLLTVKPATLTKKIYHFLTKPVIEF